LSSKPAGNYYILRHYLGNLRTHQSLMMV